MLNISTIYIATNIHNGKYYIGFDSNWPKRRSGHLQEAFNLNQKSCNHYFHRAIRKYGKDAFQWNIIYQSYDKTHTLKEMEPYFIKEYDAYKNGYNMTFGGEGPLGRIPWNKGLKLKPKGPMSEEIKKKISNSKLGWNPSKETRQNMSNSRKKWKYTDEQKRKIALANTGKHHSEETKRKIRLANVGKHHSEESKQKMSKAYKGRIPWNKGLKTGPQTLEHIQKVKISKGTYHES